MARNYWITTKWPSYVDDVEEDEDFWVSLQRGREKEAKEKLNDGDLIFIYELKTGPAEKESKVKRKKGYGGIIALVRATSSVELDSESECTDYDDDKRRCWKWYVETETVKKNPSIKRKRLNRILGNEPDYRLRNFGKKGSGLKNIKKNQFCDIIRIFDSKLYKKYCR